MSTSAKPQRIFLSYAREDKRHVEKLAMFLKDSGHLVWWDQEIHAGIDYRQEIAEQLRTSEPQAVLMADTTQENQGRIPLHSNDRKQEVLVTVTRLPTHNNVRLGRETELQALKEKGAVANYLGPSKDSNWSDWYVISGITAEGKEFYFRRWFTDKDVVSVEFEYTADKIGLYNDVIGAMTTGGRFQIDTEKH